ncbi:purine-nucleoside phosphorylase [Planococcus sp. N028]|uniref:Purine nucleoside phosphorylase DeoD-type n=1 Tax=Planococcus shixiaomingii TaxID=3058393 RepID=A0ABT8MY82_9BACL|nr:MULTISPECIES: purine-nucleoside phosphorylase [unclassified Planococcus (in: firmicutes)]MDN7240600.1 purine-nucleoside phosphorylase [Planococcus sp. N028]WKA56489.1 purine-nucleoside phosphorylase [Planococcus sp. N022]
MSFHIGAKAGEVAELVLLPGDPLRAKYIAETFLEDAVCYNTVRGMLGYTGTYKGHRVSVQGTGMGMPSASIYIHELIEDYGAKKLIRVGTCGAIQNDVKIRDVIIAQAAATDSAMIRNLFPGVDFPQIANFGLMKMAHDIGTDKGLNLHVGNVLSSDLFYTENHEMTNKLGEHGVLAVEMESAALYYLSAKFGVQGLTLLTVSDHILTGEQTTAEERQTTFSDMIEVALETITK